METTIFKKRLSKKKIETLINDLKSDIERANAKIDEVISGINSDNMFQTNMRVENLLGERLALSRVIDSLELLICNTEITVENT